MSKLDIPEAGQRSELAVGGEAEAALNVPRIPIPTLRPYSGLYEAVTSINIPPIPVPIPAPIPIPRPQTPQPGGASDESTAESEASTATTAQILLTLRREQLRLDVDGLYPQRTASGTLYGRLAPTVHWIANVANTGPSTWSGNIWYKDGAGVAAFPYTNVSIKVNRSWFTGNATITYSGGGAAPLSRVLPYKSPYFRPVNLEFDCAQGTTPVLDIQTYAHPNHPATLPNETLSIQTVYRRTGFDVTTNAGNIVPLAGAGANARWSDQEMHDAMQTYWSRFANAPQWAFWTFFASLSESGTSLGGIMFDDIGPNQRQGTAIFVDAFIANPPPGDPAPAAWVRRMRFWTAVHEMGHTFNLAHSWQKSLGTPWIPLANEPLARSFMNYPYVVPGGQSAFFADFGYRFSDQELLFMRHAPERFVEQGNADWFDHHGFQQSRVSTDPKFTLELHPPRPGGTLEFLEPAVLDLKLTNVSGDPQIVDEKLLADADGMTVIVKKKGKKARQYVPFARRCYQHTPKVLGAGESMMDSVFVGAGRNGWDLAEPGDYIVQIMLHLDEEDVLSAPLPLHVQRPASYDEDNFASEFFSDDVGRVLAFDGTRTLTRASDTLEEAADRLKERRVAIHAHVALGSALARPAKTLDVRETDARIAAAAASGGKIQQVQADEKRARQHLEVLTKQPSESNQTLGSTDYAYYLEQHDEILGAKATRERLLEIAAKHASALPAPILARARNTTSRPARPVARAEK